MQKTPRSRGGCTEIRVGATDRTELHTTRSQNTRSNVCDCENGTIYGTDNEHAMPQRPIGNASQLL